MKPRNMPDHYDVIIVGCGPVGVTMAHLLGHQGISTLIIEAGTAPYDLPRAVHIDHEIMRIFQSAGLADLILPQLTMPAGAMHFGADRAVIRQFQEIVKTDRLGWGSDYFFYQPDLERLLRQQILERKSVKVLINHRAIGVQQNEHMVSLSYEGRDGPKTATAQYLLACDGGRSTVRKSVGIALEDLGFDEPWIVIDALVDAPILMPDLAGTPSGVNMQDVMFIVGDPKRPTSVIPGVGRHRRWEFMMLPDESPDDFTDPKKIQALLSPWLGEQPYELIRCAVYRFHALLAETWQAGRVFLVGDAAHQTPPFFGQGLCHGLRDAANLSWKLKLVMDRRASPRILESYFTERQAQVRNVIEASIRVGRYICTLDAEAAKRRDTEMRATALRTAPGYVDLIPPLKSGILGASDDEATPRGSRFIQPPVIDYTGKRCLLDDATGGGFVLLTRSEHSAYMASVDRTFEDAIGLKHFRILESGACEPVRENSLADCTGELFQWFEHYKCAGVLIRPDAYVFGTFAHPAQYKELLTGLRHKIAEKIDTAQVVLS